MDLVTDKEKSKVLVVDDEKNIRDTLMDLFSLHGYEVCSASDGEDGINVALENNPDIIITDIMMPKLNGYEMVKRIKSYEYLRKTPIIFLSAKNDVEDIRDGLTAGADDYILKPFKMEEIVGSVKLRLDRVSQFKAETKELKQNVEELSKTNEHLMTATFRERDLRKKLQETLDELEKTKKQVEKQNIEIKDSINYSEKIQKAIIPQNKELQSIFSDSMMLFKPRDIVSGDFPWLTRVDKYVYIGAIDCTGHGVPGAMLAIIGNLLLNDVSNDSGVLKPSELLWSMNNSLFDLFSKSNYENQIIGGMDVAMLRIDTESNEVLFSGAFRPVHHVHSNGKIEVHKGTRRSIGGFYFNSSKTFEDIKIQAKKGDSIFIQSDGYIDQLSEEDLKLGRLKFEEVVSKNQDQSMDVLATELEATLDNWRGSVKQIDDVLIIGVKI